MAIEFDREQKIFMLQAGSDLSYAFFIGKDGFLNHLYFGPRVNTVGLMTQYAHPLRSFAPYPSAGEPQDSREVNAAEFAGFNTGDFRSPSAKVQSGSGHLAGSMTYQSHRIYAGKKTLSGLPSTRGGTDDVDTLEIILSDRAAGVDYILSYNVFRRENALTRSVRAVNRSPATVYLHKIASCTVDFQCLCPAWDLISLPGGYAGERHFERQQIRRGLQLLAGNRGLSGHNMNPFLALAEPSATEQHGVVYGFTLLYSGNFAAEIEYNQFADLRVQLGINPENFMWRLDPGEEFSAPEAVLTVSRNGLGGMSRNFHDLFRNHLIREQWRKRSRPLLVNNWEATYFDFDQEKLFAIAQEAARCGIDMLVLDDGWFGKRDSDNCSLGDWTVNKRKLPDSLSGIAMRLQKLGMKFGLWFEPEMVSPESELYRKHPDWCLHIPGRDRSLSRQQLVLDMSRPEVVDYLFEAMCAILDAAPISYIKWDANRSLTEAGSAALPPDRQQEVPHRFVLGTYALHERLLTRYPDLLIESCSGGGGRFDGGMLYYAPQIWCSDNTDAFERLKIQYGTSMVYPCSAIGAHVSISPNHQTGRHATLEARGVAAFAGTFGYELNLSRLSDAELEEIRQQAADYHRLHHIVEHGDLYRLSSPWTDSYTAWQNISKDGSEFLLSAVIPRIQAIYADPAFRIKLAGLEADAWYEETQSHALFSGGVLMNAGWLLPLAEHDGMAWRWHFRRVKQDITASQNSEERFKQ